MPWGKNWTKPITTQKCVFLVYNDVVKPLFFSLTKASVVTFNGHSQVKGGSLNWNSEGMGGGGEEGKSCGLEFPQGTDKSVRIP